MTPNELWDEVGSCFAHDDGSLPGIELHHLSSDELGSLYQSIRQQSQVVTDHPTFWDNESKSDRAIDDVPNAARLVSSRQAEPFHFAVQGIRIDTTELPCIGVHVFQDILALDYRMGSDWQPVQVFAFFRWLQTLVGNTQRGTLIPQVGEGPPEPERFADAWNKFMASQ